MKRSLLAIALCSACIAHPSFAQDNAMQDKKLVHHVGVQANELIRQVFNFNNNPSPTLNNPYLLIYSLNFAKSGWGIRTGVGYNKRTINDDNATGSLETNFDELRARLGFEKAFRLSDKWSTGAGLDFTYNNDNVKAKSVVNGFDSSTVITKSLKTSYGGGPMVWLRYNISEKVLVGTEASVYYATGFDKRTTEITRSEFVSPGPGPNPKPMREITTTVSTTDNKLSNVGINLPVAFYLIVRF
ncbi:MAG: hypothetical protein K0R82_172 [Flavipsychrobacter sp.]|jgi:opacity protein-like surface antigen|nr:hypothetical protein [Flavipsychrobacter sp.]